ncbi:alpha amylase C-terminal domain-containing protein, partial [Streptomyces sp. NPDC050264]|uniref:alpha amylase C-terminal domain-containing protein n=1 Tax=Streptomyces sp. NPDC050264 TaxID=3155038 RepID=UPI00343E16DF
NHRAYLGFMWAHPGKQLLFMGQEFAQGAEWAEEEGPQWWVLDESHPAHGDHRGVQRLVGDLNHSYVSHPALWEQDARPEGFAWSAADAADDNVFAFVRRAVDGSPLLAVTNFAPVVRHDYRLGVPAAGTGEWQEILNTDAARYGGSDVRNADPLPQEPRPSNGFPMSLTLRLPPLATVWLTPVCPD